MQNSSADYLKLMLDMAKRSGDLALKYIDSSTPSLKPDASVITKADKAVSLLCRKALKKILSDPNHILVDEEDPKSRAAYGTQAILDKTKYIWAIDPIDGTRLYANRMPLFGVSIGLIKDLKPWLGVVYFPVLKELFYCDGKEAYYVKDAFTSKAKKIKIKAVKEKLSPKSLFFCNDTFFNKFAWKDKDFHIMIHACAVVNLCWPAIGRGVGCFLKCHLWDLAGSWPIIKKAGYDFRSVTTGEVLTQVHEKFFEISSNWILKEYFLISSRENYSQIKSKIIDCRRQKS